MLASCGQIDGFGDLFRPDSAATEPVVIAEQPAPVTPAAQPAPRPSTPPQGATADTLDTSTAAEREEVTQVSAPVSGLLGETIAALGDPTKAGFWLITPLVSKETPGRVERPGGAVASVTLLPSGTPAGSGSQLSLATMRALDLDLTDLVRLKVYTE